MQGTGGRETPRLGRLRPARRGASQRREYTTMICERNVETAVEQALEASDVHLMFAERRLLSDLGVAPRTHALEAVAKFAASLFAVTESAAADAYGRGYDDGYEVGCLDGALR
jgi:hypothetical protein